MDQLTYDLQLPEENDISEWFDEVVTWIAGYLFTQDFESINLAVDHMRTIDDYPNLTGQYITEWLEDYADPLEPNDRMRIMAQDILNGANLRLHAMDCATNYVEYLLED